MTDLIRYDLLTQKALRGVVRSVLTDAIKKGLPGEHHFYISFDTRAEGVRLSQRLRAQYPDEMTIILQHQFWDLAVDDEGFEVSLSFGGIPEQLAVPFEAIKGFFDPSVQFGLQFEEIVEGQEKQENTEGKLNPLPGPPADNKQSEVAEPVRRPHKSSQPARTASKPVPAPANPDPAPAAASTPDNEPEPSSGGAQVVRLDRFRKK